MDIEFGKKHKRAVKAAWTENDNNPERKLSDRQATIDIYDRRRGESHHDSDRRRGEF